MLPNVDGPLFSNLSHLALGGRISSAGTVSTGQRFHDASDVTTLLFPPPTISTALKQLSSILILKPPTITLKKGGGTQLWLRVIALLLTAATR